MRQTLGLSGKVYPTVFVRLVYLLGDSGRAKAPVAPLVQGLGETI